MRFRLTIELEYESEFVHTWPLTPLEFESMALSQSHPEVIKLLDENDYDVMLEQI